MNLQYRTRLASELAEITKRIEAAKAPECARLRFHFFERISHLKDRLEETRTAREARG